MKKLMTSRRNFITILFVIAVIFFLFMFSGAAKDLLNQYGVNSYAYEETNQPDPGSTTGTAAGISAVTKVAPELSAVSEVASELSSVTGAAAELFPISEEHEDQEVASVKSTEDEGYAICVGHDDKLKTLVKKWCELHDREMISYLDPADIHYDKDSPPLMIVADGEDMSRYDILELMEVSDEGITIVMATMPKYSIIERDEDIRRFLGIEETRGRNVWLEGVWLYNGFLVGGGFDYVAVNHEQETQLQDLKRNVPWYTLLSGTKEYMVGVLPDDLMEEQPEDETNYKNFNLPAIVWRNSTQKGYVFCVNSNYMSDITAYGFLSAMEYESSDYVIYPVVNAQSTVMVNFPTAVRENGDELDRIYSRNSLTLERDVVWPGVAGVADRDNAKLTCMLSAKIDQAAEGEPDKDSTIFFMKLIKEIGGEAGISLKIKHGDSIEGKLKYDREFLDSVLPDYTIQTAYIDDLDMSYASSVLGRSGYPAVKSYILNHDDTKPMMGVSEDGKVFLRPVNEGDHHTFSDDLRMRSIQTVLAYSMVVLDITDVIYPKSEYDQWQKYYDRYASYSNTFFKNFDLFEEVTTSVAAKRAENFMGIEYVYRRKNDQLTVTGDRIGAYYMIRTHGEKITDMLGGEYSKVDDSAYIIHVNNLSAAITFEEEGVSIFR